jgi:CheY-like chemotaxis protein
MPEIQNQKYLVIDDVYATDERSKRNFINRVKLTPLQPQFAYSCEESLKILQQNTNFALCFLDCTLPLYENSIVDYSNIENLDEGISLDNGIKLIPEIYSINNKLPIIIISRNFTTTELKAKIAEYSKLNTVVDVIHKNESPTKFRSHLSQVLSSLGISLGEHSVAKTNISQPTLFDYESLDKDTRTLIRTNTENIIRLVRRTSQDILDIGRYLTEIKESLKHGEFEKWLKSEVPFSLTTAARVMRAYEKFKSVNMTDLNIEPSAIYELTARAVPQEVVNRAVELAQSGEKINIQKAKKIIGEHKAPKQERKSQAFKSQQSILPLPNQDKKQESDVLSFSKPISEEAEENPSQNLEGRSLLENVQTREKYDTTSKQQIVKIISKQNIWQIGEHILYCGDPNSSKFLQLLPNSITLCLSFSKEKNWQSQFDKYASALNFYSEYEDLDLEFLLESVRKTIEITTSERDDVLVNFLPHPTILNIIGNLGCRAYIAEPDRQKCQELLNTSQTFLDEPINS